MMTYIQEEEPVLKKIIRDFAFEKLMAQLPEKIERILILATGSSLNAALAAKYALEESGDLNVTLEEPFNFQHYGHLDRETDLIIAISQSGKSTSTINVLAEPQLKNIPSIAMTSYLTSPLVEKADYLLDLNVGEETVGYVTKGYSGTVLNLFLIGYSIALKKKIMTQSALQEKIQELQELISEIPSLIQRGEEFFQQQSEKFLDFSRYACIAYGANLGVAKEFETKFTETIRLPSSGFELEAYMHGPYLEAQKNHGLLFLLDQSENAQRGIALKNYLRPHVGTTITIVQNEKITPDFDFNLATKTQDKLLLPLLFVVLVQTWAYCTAGAKKIDLAVDPYPDFDESLKSKLV